jgi:GNAT superfamily N-acetyltransferase
MTWTRTDSTDHARTIAEHPRADATASQAGAAAALRRAYLLFADRIPGGGTRLDDSGAATLAIPVPKARMNGLLLPPHPVDPGRLRELAEPFTGGPWSMSAVDHEAAGVGALAAELGLVRVVLPSLTLPLRVLTAQPPRSASEEVLAVGSDAERLLWATTCDVAFGSPAGLSARLLTPELAAAPEVRAHLAVLDGRPVATALSVLDEQGWLGLFTVATVPEARGRGVGARLVRAVLEDGARRGARTAHLQSSDMARSLYERIGFRDDLHPTVSFETP